MEISKGRLEEALAEIGKKLPESIPGYKYIWCQETDKNI